MQFTYQYRYGSQSQSAINEETLEVLYIALTVTKTQLSRRCISRHWGCGISIDVINLAEVTWYYSATNI